MGGRYVEYESASQAREMGCCGAEVLRGGGQRIEDGGQEQGGSTQGHAIWGKERKAGRREKIGRRATVRPGEQL